MAKRKKTLEELQLELKDSIEALGCIEVLGASSRHGDIRFLCKVSDTDRWSKAMHHYLLREVTDGDWYSFLGTKYMVANNKVVFGWVLLWETEDAQELDKVVRDVRKLWSLVREDIDGQRIKAGITAVGKPWNSAKYEEKVLARTGPIRGEA